MHRFFPSFRELPYSHLNRRISRVSPVWLKKYTFCPIVIITPYTQPDIAAPPPHQLTLPNRPSRKFEQRPCVPATICLQVQINALKLK